MISKSTGTEKATASDPHPRWLDELRRQSVRISGGLPDDQPGTVPHLQEEISALREQIIETDPTGKFGVLAQVDLLKDLAWSDPVRRLACNIGHNIKQLWPEEA